MTPRQRVVAAMALAITLAAPARADLPTVVPPEDEDSHAMATARPWRASLWITRASDGDAGAVLSTLQLASGPHRSRLPVRDLSLGWLERWSLRARLAVLRVDEDDRWLVGPLTLAAHRPWTFALGGGVSLAHLHAGIESAISTPWLRDGDAALPAVVRASHRTDSELVESGWSVRPLGAHVRLDLFACRSIHAEAGFATELFRSTTERDRATALGARFHGAVGFSLACVHRRRRLINDVTVAAQWRARTIAVRGDEGAGFADGWSFGLDLDRGTWALAAFAAPPVEAFGVDAWKVGFRLQLRSQRGTP